jgi:hypothetical protein
MTLPYERNMSIENTRNFLRALLDPKQTPKVPRKVRQRAYWCLRHFPNEFDMSQLKSDGKVFEDGTDK